MGASVFLSFSNEDREQVEPLIRDLESHGIVVRQGLVEMLVGDNIFLRINQILKECDYVAVWFTQNSVSSRWVEEEWSIALERQRKSGTVHLLPLLADDCEPPFEHLHFADFRKSYEEGLGNLLARLGAPVAPSKKTVWKRLASRMFPRTWTRRLAAVLIALSLLSAGYGYLKLGPWREAQSLLAQVSRELAPGFPSLLSRDPISPESLSPGIEKTLERVQSLIAPAIPGTQGQRLKGELLMARAVLTRHKEEYCRRDNNTDCAVLHAAYRRYVTQSAEDLSSGSLLPLLRELEDRVDRIDELAKQAQDAGRSPCATKKDAEEWREENRAADLAFQTLTGQPTLPFSLRGSLWMLRGEQAYWRAGVCGEPVVAQRAQALVSFTRAAELSQPTSGIAEAMAEVVRSGSTEETSVSPAGRRRMVEQVQGWVSRDARQIGDDSMVSNRAGNASRAVDALLADWPTRMSWLVAVYTDLGEKGQKTPRQIHLLADALIAAGRPEEAAGRLARMKSEEDSYVHGVLSGKALCFSQKFVESLPALNTVALRRDQEADLGERWGYASILATLCEVAAGRRPADPLQESLRRMDLAAVQTEICDIRLVAPALAGALRQHGLERLVDRADCSDTVPAPTSAVSRL